MEFINDGFPEGRQILVEKISVNYLQPNDSTESDEEGQSIELETRNAGGGIFIHMKTNGWSIDSEEELLELVKDFKNRANINE